MTVRIAAISACALLAIGLAGCEQSETAKNAANARMYEAVTDAVCAESREDVELALGKIATEAFYQDQDTIDDTVTQMAQDVTCPAKSTIPAQ